MKTKIICLTPVKNEAWILPEFLKAASLWADRIIIADQSSSDGSAAIAQKFPKVTLISNPDPDFNEPERQQLLINEARKIPGKKILLALDADEFLTPNFISSEELKKLKSLPPGTVIKFTWCNLRPGLKQYWLAPQLMSFGFVDDGTPHRGSAIHSPRIPLPDNPSVYVCRDLQVLHLQYLDWKRMQSKHRWYQAYEIINRGRRDYIFLYRQYHHMDSVKNFLPLSSTWISAYRRLGVRLAPTSSSYYYWDRQVLDLFSRYGTSAFRRLAIWDFDWTKAAAHFGVNHPQAFSDPRRFLDRLIHRYLSRTQPLANSLPVKLADYLLQFIY